MWFPVYRGTECYACPPPHLSVSSAWTEPGVLTVGGGYRGSDLTHTDPSGYPWLAVQGQPFIVPWAVGTGLVSSPDRMNVPEINPPNQLELTSLTGSPLVCKSRVGMRKPKGSGDAGPQSWKGS